MKTYIIYRKPASQDIYILKDGFSKPAAIFSFFWAVYHNIWWLAAILLLGSTISEFLPESNEIIFYASTLIMLFFGSDMLSFELERKGYKMSGIVLADTEEKAELRYYEINR